MNFLYYVQKIFRKIYGKKQNNITHFHTEPEQSKPRQPLTCHILHISYFLPFKIL